MAHSAQDGLAKPLGGAAPRAAGAPPRVRAHGKFFFAGDEKLYLKGVTYGPFRPDGAGEMYGARETASRDLARMAENGINTIRTYTVPPRWLVDLAAGQGLRMLAGVPWEQHVAFLDSSATRRRIRRTVTEAARGLAAHPGVLGLAVGNEIPAPIVRLYGATRIERFIAELADAAKQADPEALVTYVNYPTTEYLELPFLDFMAFNVYLEQEADFRGYLRRLQNLAGERPLVLGELGLDSRRNGLEKQAETLEFAAPRDVRRGRGRRVRVWLDRRVAPRRARDRGLGFRPDDARARAEARARHRAPRLRRGAVPPRAGMAAHLGGGVQLQRRAHHPRHARPPGEESTTRTTRSSSSTTARRTRPRRSPRPIPACA